MSSNNNLAQLLLAVVLVATCCIGLALGSPFNHNAAAHTGEQDDEAAGELPMMMGAANKRGDETGGYEPHDTDLNDFGGSFKGAAAAASYDQQDQVDVGPQQHHFQQRRPGQGQHHHQAEASENSETNDDDDDGSDADEDSSSQAEAVTLETAGASGGRRNAMAIARALAESSQAQPWLEGSGSQAHQLGLPAGAADEADFEQSGPFGSDSNIANAKIELSPQDKVTAAGHHHHHGHHVHGWLKMGAETGKKGAFKWHDKHPVGGKGRR